MAQSGKRGRSRPTRTPVTIDLDSKDVSKETSETPADDSKASDKSATSANTPSPSEAVPPAEPVAMDSPAEEAAAAVASQASGPSDADKSDVSPSTVDAPKPVAAGSDEKSDEGVAAASGLAAVGSSSGSGSGRGLVGGLVGGAIAFAGLFGLQWAGVLPGGASTGDTQATAPAVVDNSQELISLEARVEALAGQVATLESTPPSGEASDAASAQSFAALEQRVEEIRAALSTGAGGDGAAVETLNSRVQEIEAQLSEVDGQVDTLATAVSESAQGGSEGGDPGVIAGLTETLGSVQGRLDSLEGALQSTEAAGLGEALTSLGTDIDTLRQQVTSLDEAVSSGEAQRNDLATALDSVRQTVDALSGRVSQAEETLAQSGSGETVARAVAAASLKSAIDRGLPFMPELEAFATVAGGDDVVETLRNYAPTGVPTLTQLVEQFQPVANAIVTAGQGLDENASVADRLMSSARSLVQVRPVGDVEGESAGAIAARIEARLRDGNLQAAIDEWETLPDAAKAVSQEFHEDMQARAQVDALIGGVLNDAMTATVTPATQQ